MLKAPRLKPSSIKQDFKERATDQFQWSQSAAMRQTPTLLRKMGYSYGHIDDKVFNRVLPVCLDIGDKIRICIT